MALFRLSCFLLAATFAVSCDCDHPDWVEKLPGWNQPLPSRWYSGFLEYEFHGRQVRTHYTLVEAEDDPHDEKPLIYWSNGGPGASSLFGLLTEVGPLLFSDLSLQTDDYRKTGIPTPLYNSNTWTRLGSILIFDQPAPVGFSYCNDEPDSHSCGGLSWTDELTSENAYTALRTFYDKFPCYQPKPLYLTGESYGGIYIPTLARRVLEDSSIDLKGFAVGDGCLGTETSICGMLSPENGDDFVDIWEVIFLAGHGQIPLQTLREIMRECRGANEGGNLRLDSSPLCQEAVAKMEQQKGGVYDYSLYDECTYSNGLLEGALNDYPCGGDLVMESYLSMQVVKDALHVPEASFFSVDNAEGDFDYTPTEKDLTGFYKDIQGQTKVLIYNGDTDPAITSFAAQNWTSHLGFEEVEGWRPWTVDGCRRMGGYVTRYEGDFDFLTIRGAGHMVPTFKGDATFTFLSAWLGGTEYPAYDKDCAAPSSTEIEPSGPLMADSRRRLGTP